MATDILQFKIETEPEEDGKRWIAEIIELPGVLAYGKTEEAIAHAQALGLRVLVDRIEHGEAHPDFAPRFILPKPASRDGSWRATARARSVISN